MVEVIGYVVNDKFLYTCETFLSKLPIRMRNVSPPERCVCLDLDVEHHVLAPDIFKALGRGVSGVRRPRRWNALLL
jgi:hypothetical protein